MANLTDRLPLTDGTNRVYEGIQGPSAIGTVADFVSSALGNYAKLKDDMAQARARKKKEDDEAAKAAIAYEAAGAPDRAVAMTAQQNGRIIAAQAQAADQRAGIMSSGDAVPATPQFDPATNQLIQPVEPPKGVQDEIRRSATQAMSIADAVDQGRMPPITVEAALNADFRRLRDKYPEHVEYIVDIFTKMGIKDNLFTELQDAKDEREFHREEAQAAATNERVFRQTTIEAARVALGTESVNKSDDELYLYGLTIRKSAYDLEQVSKENQAKLALAQAGQIDRDQVEKDLNQNIERIVGNMVFNDSAQYIQFANNIVDAILKDPNNPNHIQRLQALGVKANQLVQTSTNHSVELARKYGYTGDESKLRSYLQARFEPILSLFQGDYSVIKVNIDALNAIQTAAKLNAAEALPLFTALTAAGMKPTDMPGFMKAVETDKKLQQGIADEVRGFSNDWGADRASTHVMNIIKLLRGEATLKYADPATVSRTIPALVTTSVENAKAYNSGKGVDGDAIVNGVGEIAIQTRALGPSTGSALTDVATHGFANIHVRNALIKMTNDKNVDPVMLKATIQASRAASAHMLENIRMQTPKINQANPYYSVYYDKRDGKYKINQAKLNAARQANAAQLKNPPTGDRDFQTLGAVAKQRALQSMKPPKDMINWVDAANTNLDNAIDLGRVDPSTPKGSDLQLRNWYALNEPLPQEGSKPIDVEKEMDKMFDKFDTMIDQGIRSATQGVELPADMKNPAGLKHEIISGEAGPAGYDSVYGDTANGNSFGFTPPKPPSQMTIQEAIDYGRKVMIPATRGKVGAGDLGTSAIGAYQFTQETLAEFAPKVFGKDWKNVVLSGTNQDLLADAIIASTNGNVETLIGRWPSLRNKLK